MAELKRDGGRIASCGVHTEDEAQRSIRHEVCEPAPEQSVEQVTERGGRAGMTPRWLRRVLVGRRARLRREHRDLCQRLCWLKKIQPEEKK